jgi:hypothetical protein
MAETKAKKRAAPKRANSSRKRKTTKPKSRATAKPRSKSRSTAGRRQRSSNGAGQLDAVRQTVEDKAKDAGQAVSDAAGKAGGAASKAKIPLLAGGAALAGVAGGIALTATRHGNRHPGITRARRPRIKVDSDDVAKAAKHVGRFSAQVGELATGVQRATESTNGNDHHRRSPVEVVLQGLTARR